MFFNLWLGINLAKLWSPAGSLVCTAEPESHRRTIRKSRTRCAPGMSLERLEILKLRDMAKELLMYLLFKNFEINRRNSRKALETKSIPDTLRVLNKEKWNARANLIKYRHRLNN